MADKDLELSVEEESSGGGGSSKLLIIIVIVVLLLGGGAAAFFMMSGSDDASPKEDETEEQQKPAIYVPLRPEFVVNFHHQGKQHYLQINISLMTRDPMLSEVVNTHKPLVRSALVTLLGSQDFSELRTPDGKEALRVLALEELNALLSENAGIESIEEVLFTNFVMQ